jgi:hypothetical protein
MKKTRMTEAKEKRLANDSTSVTKMGKQNAEAMTNAKSEGLD